MFDSTGDSYNNLQATKKSPEYFSRNTKLFNRMKMR